MANRALMTPTDQPSASSADRRLQRARHDRAEPDEQQVAALAQRLALPDRQDRTGRSAAARTRIARIVQRERVILGERGPQQRAQLLLVLRRCDDQVRELALGGDREHALVRRAVLADEPGPVDRDQHRLVVLAHVVDGLVEGALEERRVQRDDRAHPAHRETGRERHGVLLGDPDVEHPLGEDLGELGHPGAGRHPGGDPDDPPVVTRDLDQLGGEHRRVVRVLPGRGRLRGR